MKSKNRLNLNYWLRKIYTSKFFQLLPIDKLKLKKKVFTSIYKSKHWVQDEDILPKDNISVSGHGSNTNTEQFHNLSNNFNKILDQHNIKSILDIPCGDFLWMNEIIKNRKINYLGIDIVDELIEENIKKYQKDNITFKTHDITNFPFRENFDLILIRDLFIHINNSDISKIINNLKNGNFKYLALNSYNNTNNEDVTIGKHRKVNLLIEPFNLSEPLFTFKDFEMDKYIFLYEKQNFL